ncbi:MAG: SPOR domain-containing protein [Nitrospinota bacterium]|nr:SPOR domain-containing protein [Nitrospinota bacterium]
MRNIPQIPEEDQAEYSSRDYEDQRPRSSKKGVIILGGVAVGLAMALYFSQTSPPSNAPPVTVKRVSPAPAQDAAPAPDAQASAAQTSPEELDPGHVERRLAALSKENLIAEDLTASGVKIDEPAPPMAPPTPPPASPEPQTSPTPKPPQSPQITEPAPAPVAPPQKKSAQGAKPLRQERPYTVQIISTTDALKALEVRDRLAAAGYSPWIATGSAQDDSYRVEVGVYNSIKDAAPISARLADAGYPNRAAYLAGGKMVTLVAGVFSRQDDARGLDKRIKSSGFDSRIRLRSDSKSLYMVRVGKFEAEDDAREMMISIRKSGFNPTGIGN